MARERSNFEEGNRVEAMDGADSRDVKEIQERKDAVMEIEKNLLELHQIFLDMIVFIYIGWIVPLGSHVFPRRALSIVWARAYVISVTIKFPQGSSLVSHGMSRCSVKFRLPVSHGYHTSQIGNEAVASSQYSQQQLPFHMSASKSPFVYS